MVATDRRGAGALKYEDFSAIAADVTAVPETENDGLYARYGKRLFDLVCAGLLLPLLVPVIAILWLIARRDGGPGFYGHERVGRDGVTFKCWKVRSMVHDAEVRLDNLLKRDPAARQEWENNQKLSNDPRITAFGSFIRKTSLDELPQIINVIRGEMSFVGPRPVVEDELRRYGTRKAIYLRMKPGITGLWQVNGRNGTSYNERVALDVSYNEVVSLALDVKLMLTTVRCVLFRTGI
ncbi:sugar transferase [Tateyamaria armeniaca]|uniref:Sugar transferase n=1 Tax=Tateyamaria armeniaca TaxID=2518930 RepID=A0ABW8UYN1_9RHOB